MTRSTLETAVDDLKTNGYCWLPLQLPLDLCVECRDAIQTDVGRKLDSGSQHQEEPIERLEEETAQSMLRMRDFVLNEILQKLGGKEPPAHVPEEFTDTLYGRLKRKHFHTAYHADAFNTVFQRKFLVDTNSQVAQFYSQGKLSKEQMWSDIPIFTFWIPLTPLVSAKSSHLRVLPQSHLDRTMVVNAQHTNVIPAQYKYNSKAFVGPDFSAAAGGYQVGDIVIFHCLTLHEANAHRESTPNSERVSMDGRFVWHLV